MKLTKTFNSITYPANISVGYKSDCGHIFTQTFTVSKPILNILLYTSSSGTCGSSAVQIVTKDSLSSSFRYYNTYLSIDSGATYSALNTNSIYNDSLAVGTTYHIVVASGCDTVRKTLNTPVPVLNIPLYEFTSYSCNGMSGFAISLNLGAGSYSGSADSIRFKVLNQPAGGTLIDSFTYATNKAYRLTYNLLPGYYRLAAIDQCGAKDTVAITINPTVLSYTISPMPSCISSESGLNINIAESNYQPYYRIYEYSFVRAILTNIGTGVKDSFTSVNALRPTYIEVRDLDTGRYTVKIIKVRPSGLPYPSCSLDTNIKYTIGGPLSISNYLFTSNCEDSSASIIVNASGGGGVYLYSLDQLIGSVWTNIAGPQSLSYFDGLDSMNTYRVNVTDTCGNGTQITTSFNNSDLKFKFSKGTYPCTGDSFSLILDEYADASYKWYKNGVLISGEDQHLYTIDSVGSTTDTFTAIMSVGGCDLLTTQFVLNPGLCGAVLPIHLSSFTVKESNRMVDIKWTTESELNNRGFYLNRSKDGNNWETLDFIASSARNNKSTKQTQYQYIDRSPHIGYNFYKLKQIDIQGKAHYSNVKYVNIEGQDFINLYPNPAENTLHLDGLNGKKAKINILDTKGSIIFTQQLAEHSTELNIQQLASGLYMLIVYDEDNNMLYRSKLIKK